MDERAILRAIDYTNSAPVAGTTMSDNHEAIQLHVEQVSPHVKIVRNKAVTPPLKMYILIRDDVDTGHAILAAAHGTAAACRRWAFDRGFNRWMAGSFRKVVCRLSEKEFETAKQLLPEQDFLVMTESSLDGAETCLVFKPRTEWPKVFKFYQLYR